jgi:hypothetical protein
LISERFGAFRTPSGPIFYNPIEQSLFEADIVTSFFAFDPFVAENFVSFGQEFFVEDGVFDQVVHLGRWRVHSVINHIEGVGGVNFNPDVSGITAGLNREMQKVSLREFRGSF